MDDVASGGYYHLISLPDVLALIGSFPADDPDNSGIPWVFTRNLYTRMEAQGIVKGSQAVALVCVNAGQGSGVLDYSTIRWQRLEVDIWVDPLRDAYGNVTSPSETEGRGLNVFSVLDSHLHRASLSDKTQQWGDLITVNGLRMTEPVWYPVPDGDGLIRGVCFWEVATFGNYDPVVSVSSSDAGSGADTGT
jgi:hypothetical protein